MLSALPVVTVVVLYIYIFFFHGGAGTRFKFIINSIVFAYLMRVKSADSGKKSGKFSGGSLKMMVQLCLDQSRDVNHVCVCDDVMCVMVLIIINLKRVPLIIIYLSS